MNIIESLSFNIGRHMKKIITIIAVMFMSNIAFAQNVTFQEMNALNASHSRLSAMEDDLKNNETMYNNYANAAQDAQNNGDMQAVQYYVTLANQVASTVNSEVDQIHELEREIRFQQLSVTRDSVGR
jgi:hypothetical protein